MIWLLTQIGQMASDILEMLLVNTGLLYSVNNNVCINAVYVKFEILTVVIMKMTDCSDVTPCSLIEWYVSAEIRGTLYNIVYDLSYA
jgi:hypothetical protein